MREIISIPGASRTFAALRKLGYNLSSSIADILDNSITKKVSAKNINIFFIFNKQNNIICRIHDDGCGMSPIELEEAMRLGTDTTYESNDLGKFGMGMKTAALSHCNILTVISKKQNEKICGFRWDISKITETGDWTLLQLDEKEIQEVLDQEETKLGEQGTIVLWDDLFNINREYKSYKIEKFAQNYYFRILNELQLHLGMTFHRFLDGSLDKESSVKITVNNEILTAWDPFCRLEPQTVPIVFKKGINELKIPGYLHSIKIEGYVLPNKAEFSSEEEWKKAKGLLSWNDSQGYYIYRANRIIRFGGWHGTKAKDEHDKLARISIDIDPSLDELFSITVSKTKVQFPEVLFHHLKSKVNPQIVKVAKAKYNKSAEKLSVKNKFRNNQGVVQLAKDLLEEKKIKTSSNEITVEVQNPTGTWLSNKINDFLNYGSDKDYEIISANFDNEEILWKIICNKDEKFKVVINAKHPFYSRIYVTSPNDKITSTIDAFIFSLAFAELYNKTDQNAHLFDTFKTVTSQVLAKLTKEKII